MDYQIEQILEFKQLFPDEVDFNIQTILKKYSKEQLVRLVNVLSNNYKTAYIPDNQNKFFSQISNRRLPELERRLLCFLKKHNTQRVCYTTPQTALELMRYIFDIPIDDYQNSSDLRDFEYDIFRVLLKINELLMEFELDEHDSSRAKLMFLLQYTMNDISLHRIEQSFRTQLIYYTQLTSFVNSNIEIETAKNHFLQHIGITEFQEYLKTVASCIAYTYNAINTQLDGCLILNLQTIEDIDNCFNKYVLDSLSLTLNDYIPYGLNEYKSREDNVDYRSFRSFPIIKLSENEYIFYCFPILVETLYNSLFFNLKKYYTKDFFSFYNKSFVEHKLFQEQMLKCIKKGNYSFPTKEILELESFSEEPNQPDFYIRENNENIILFECKAIKLNGKLKDKKNMDELLSELKNKLYLSTHQNGKPKKQPERIGITQLLYQIDLIETYQFTWDLNIPDKVAYYPVLVIEDSKIVQPGIFYILNQWYKANKDKDFLKVMCHPIIVMSIDILYLYEHIFEAKGFHRIFDEFFNECITYNEEDWVITNQLADFNEFIARKYKLSKNKAAKIHDSYMQKLGLTAKPKSL